MLPRLLADKLIHDGCLVFSSAAALTLGRWTVPVYEIYKVGADPVWERGLGPAGALGLDVAVIPHYDNAEGGTHDTRYCYLGEVCLRPGAQLPEGGWVLGVDEHTACVFDLEAGTVVVAGLGTVTVRRALVVGANGSKLDESPSRLDGECEWLIANGVLPTDVVTGNRRVAEAALRPWKTVFTHGDLQIAHVFVDGDEITGVIDWSDAGRGDALFDLAILTLGHEEHLGDVVAGYGTDVDLDVIRGVVVD